MKLVCGKVGGTDVCAEKTEPVSVDEDDSVIGGIPRADAGEVPGAEHTPCSCGRDDGRAASAGVESPDAHHRRRRLGRAHADRARDMGVDGRTCRANRLVREGQVRNTMNLG